MMARSSSLFGSQYPENKSKTPYNGSNVSVKDKDTTASSQDEENTGGEEEYGEEEDDEEE